MHRTPLAATCLLLFAAPCVCQQSAAQRAAAVDQQVAAQLVGFAQRAESGKQPARALRVYRDVLEHWDAANAAARKALGWKQQKGEWTPPAAPPKAVDTATTDQRKRLDDAWKQVATRGAQSHRDLGKVLLAEGATDAGRREYELALRLLPDDVDSHVALGHRAIDGFYGTDAELAFVQRMRSMIAKAHELAAAAPTSEALPGGSLPKELRGGGLPFAGARGKHFTWWCSDGPEAAANCVVWSERSFDLATFLLGDAASRVLRPRARKWSALVRGDGQRDTMLEKCPDVRGGLPVEQAKLFSAVSFQVLDGEAELGWSPVENDPDHAVASVTKRSVVGGRNVGLGEGLVHATTWLLCGTMETAYCNLPATTAGATKPQPREPAAWLERLHQQIETGTDWPLAQLPRERADNFHEDARIKAWSFVLWLLARHPDKWLDLFDRVTTQTDTPEAVAAAFEKALGRKLDDVEAEWREWARAGSRLGVASGFAP